MQFRKAQNRDLSALVTLQNQNSIVVDPTMDRTDGALASAYTAEDFAAINRDLGIVVCLEESAGDDIDKEEKLLGFVCGSTPQFNLRAGLPSAMIAGFDRAKLDGKPLSQWRCAIFGPVCVEKNSRGQGIFEGLYGELWRIIPTEYEAAVALVSTNNPRSLAAHKKLGMVEVDQFIYNGSTYNTIAIKIATVKKGVATKLL